MTEPSFDPPEEGPKMMPEKAKHTRRSITPVRVLNAVDKIVEESLELEYESTIYELSTHLKELIVQEAQNR